LAFLTKEPSMNDILAAKENISKFIHRTPIFTSRSIDSIADTKIFFKCENFQKAGAFKFRGASNSIFSLNNNEAMKGVATHSSGNHGAALALAARMRGVQSFVVMPHTAPAIKQNAVKEYGGNITYCEPSLESRETVLKEVISKTGAAVIHPYDNYSIIAGQATCAMEIFGEGIKMDYLIAPVSGGGLLSGSSLAAKYFSPNTIVIGAEPEGANDAFKSFRDNKIYPSVMPKTICDGLLTSLSQKTFPIIKNNVDRILTVPDSEIIEAMRLIWERMKIIVEPSSAVALAVVLRNKRDFFGKKVAIILSGGNVDIDKLPFHVQEDLEPTN
jgi:threonine dehydratase